MGWNHQLDNFAIQPVMYPNAVLESSCLPKLRKITKPLGSMGLVYLPINLPKNQPNVGKYTNVPWILGEAFLQRFLHSESRPLPIE